MNDLYIGLISGTSMDGIDAALVEFGDRSLDVLRTHEHDYPSELRSRLFAARADASLSRTDDVADLHRAVGECFRDAALALLQGSGAEPSSVAAIGSHGQTIRHEPDADEPFSLQIGDAEVIAGGTGITTIADFRAADIALGGQGAPLASAFHEWLFRTTGATRVVVNIGGIANITVLPGGGDDSSGFDTGPGNTLLDAWCAQHTESAFDRGGAWAARGVVDHVLLERLLADPYFAAPPPKSTGFEYFHLDWLAAAGPGTTSPVDVQATLCQLTADTIAGDILSAAPDASEVLVCGGGVHNADLMQRLRRALPELAVSSTATAGLEPDWVEAAVFAWLAMRTLDGQPGNLPAVTGASRRTVLGVRHEPRVSGTT